MKYEEFKKKVKKGELKEAKGDTRKGVIRELKKEALDRYELAERLSVHPDRITQVVNEDELEQYLKRWKIGKGGRYIYALKEELRED